MTNLITQLYADEAGFIVSAELALVTTIAVLSMDTVTTCMPSGLTSANRTS